MFGFGGYNPSQNTSTSSKGRQDRDTQYQGGGYDSSKNVSNRDGLGPQDRREQYRVQRTLTPISQPVDKTKVTRGAQTPPYQMKGGQQQFISPTLATDPTIMPPDLEEDLETPIQVPTKQNTLLDFFSTPKLLGILGKFLPKTDFQSYYDKYGIEDKYGFTPEQFKNLVMSGDISIKGVPMKGNIGFTGGGDQPVRIVGGGEGGQQPSGIQTIATPITSDEEEIDTITEEDVSVDGDRQAYYDDLYEQLIAAGISPSNASMIAEYRSDVRFPTA